MKKYILTLLVMAFTLSLFGTDFHVGPNQTYTTIQAAYNVAHNVHVANIIVHPYTYCENINLANTGQLEQLFFTSIDPDDPAIVNSTIIMPLNIGTAIFDRSGINFDDTAISIEGFTLTTDLVIPAGIGINYDYNAASSTSPIKGLSKCIISNLGAGLKNYSTSNFLLVSDCTFLGNNVGFTGYIFPNNRGTSLTRCFFYQNGIGIVDKMPVTSSYPTSIYECTIADNNIGIRYFNTSIRNTILYGNNTNLEIGITGAQISCTYSDIEGGYTGTGNIDKDPEFCMGNDYKYHLLESSPCIDAGDPNSYGGDVRIDMGCYESTTDIKPLTGNHWNWVSYPRLTRTGNNPVNAPNLLDDMLPMPAQMGMKDEHQYLLQYDGYVWSDPSYTITSDKGYKLTPDENGSYLLPEEGTRLDSSFVIHLDAGENWVGYWLPGSENWSDALGICKDAFTQIKAETWTMTKVGGSWWGPSRATFDYGKGYIMYVDANQYPNGLDFYWNITFHSGGRFVKSEPENFTYQEKADYEVIDIQSIEDGENIDEIGAFVDGVCVGASKVEEYPVQILAYTEDANKGDDNTLYFEVVSGKGTAKKVNDISEYNPKTGEYEKATLNAGTSMHHLIKLGGNDYTEHPINSVLSLTNYPNPFNPETSIAFNLPQDEFIKIEIYNIKGQKVKTLANGQFQQGTQSFTWKGLDNNGKHVASGIYMYKLITKDKTISKKMLMLK